MEATLEHPFFVYNQGWSSYCPERTLLRYGLHCRQLIVGNSCISLTHRDPRLPGPHASTARVNPTKPEPGEIVPRSDTAGVPNYEPCRKMPRRESVVKAYSAQPPDPACFSSTAWLQGHKDLDQSSGKSPQSVITARSTPTVPAVRASDVAEGDSGQGLSKCSKRRRWSASDVKIGCDPEEESITEKGPGSVKSRPVAVAITMKGSTVDEAMGVGQLKMTSAVIDG